MPVSFDGKLVVAISSRALFDLEEPNRVFEEEASRRTTATSSRANEVLALASRCRW
jgi:5'-nucleotidase